MEHKIHGAFGRMTQEEARARRSVLGAMRGAVLSFCSGQDEMREVAEFFDIVVTQDTPLSTAYDALTAGQRLKLHDMIENPAVRVSIEHDGVRYDPFALPEQDLLSRLKKGIYVGAPSETHVARPAGTPAV